MNKLDAKYSGTIRKAKDGSIVPDDEWMVFLAHDDAFPRTLEFYYAECVRLGADAEQLAAVRRTLVRLTAWRLANPDKLKTPDAAGERLFNEAPPDGPGTAFSQW